MRCWVVEQITEAGEMIWVERPDPVPGQDELLVRVKAAGVNFADTLMARGRYQRKPETPFTPGIEVAGEIVASGAGGERRGWVCANIPTGGFAELALVPERAATPIPDDVPFDIALALLGVNYPTAYYALHHRAQIRPGETVLVHAGAGGVGSAAVQTALAHGSRVIAAAGSQEKLAVCRELGAETVVSYQSPDWEKVVRAATGGAGVDVIFDPVGGRIGVDSLRCLAWRGRLLTVGFASGSIPELPSNRLLLKEGSALGVFWGEAAKRDPALLREVHAALLTLYRAKQVAPLIGARFALASAPSALAALRARKSVGKIVLAPSLEQLSD
jgi:NADPH2:quinone reductase